MSSRLKRRNRTDIVFKGCGGILDVFDDAIKEKWRINDEEFDYICTQSDEVLDAFTLHERMTISDIKHSLTVINNVLKEYYETRS